MKAKFLIILFLIFSLLGAFALKANSQQVNTEHSTKAHFSQIPEKIADETVITYSKTGARVETHSEKVFDDILRVWEPYFKRVTISYKNEDNAITKKWLIYMTRLNGINLQQWAKKHL